jgi:hypothetical protein
MPSLLTSKSAAVAQHREHDPAQPMGHGDHRALIAVLGTLLREIGVQGMLRAGGMVGRLTEHRAQFGRAAFGDATVHIARPRLIG